MSALRARLAGVGLLALCFALFSSLVAGGHLDASDRSLGHALEGLYRESLRPLFQALAVLGGIELTSLAVLGLGFQLWARGLRDELWALAAFPAAILVELVYKRLLFHPGPPWAHGDGPSLSSLLGPGGALNSYPSGHVARAVVAFGLLAFAVHRLRPGRPSVVARGAAAAAVAVVVATRLYLAVHWGSDVVGGMLLGGIALLAAMIWLDRPRSEGD